MTLIIAQNLGYRYERTTVFTDLSFKIDEGSYTCLIGGNGTGKSTLLKLLCGLLPLQTGFLKKNIRAEKISYVAQKSPVKNNFPATVREIILSGTQKPSLLKPLFYSKSDKIHAEDAMRFFELERYSNRRIGELSGGQQQRVFLARAIAKKPDLLILDEPCANLDSRITAELYKLLEHYNKNYHKAIIMSTHDHEQAEKYADSFVALNEPK